MPLLILLRHAQAEPAGRGRSDHERPLSPHGHLQAASVARLMAARRWEPDLILASTATRTRETWEDLAAILAGAPSPRFSREIYEAADYLPVLRREGGAARSILLVGHNPAVQATALRLADGAPEATALREHVPPGALAVFETEPPWLDLGPGRARLLAFIPAA